MKLLAVICAVLIICLPRVNSAKTCLSLDDFIANASPTVFSGCSKNAFCNYVSCNISSVLPIDTATLTLLPCYTPPALNIVVKSNTVSLDANFTFSESETPWITSAGQNVARLSWDVDYFVEDTTFADFQLNITFLDGTEEVLITDTDIILDLSMCGAATSVKNTFAGMMLALLLALVSFTSM